MVDELQNDLRKAQLARDETRVSTLRLLLSEIKNEEITLRLRSGQESQISNEDIIKVIQHEVKKRKEAAEGFRKGGRENSALREEAELAVLQGYLPEALSNEELTKLVDRAINELGASSTADMGKVIGAVMDKVAGRTDGGTVSALVKDKLS